MAERQQVILYGDSLLLAGVQASLRISPNLELIALEEFPADWVAILHELHPSAIIFDVGGVWPNLPLTILQRSKLLLIGINADSTGTLVLSSRPSQALRAGDLVDLICQEDSLQEDVKGV